MMTRGKSETSCPRSPYQGPEILEVASQWAMCGLTTWLPRGTRAGVTAPTVSSVTAARLHALTDLLYLASSSSPSSWLSSVSTLTFVGRGRPLCWGCTSRQPQPLFPPRARWDTFLRVATSTDCALGRMPFFYCVVLHRFPLPMPVERVACLRVLSSQTCLIECILIAERTYPV